MSCLSDLFRSTLSIALLVAPLSAQWAGEWKFDETSGTTAADLTKNKNDGTLTNFGTSGHWVTGRFKGGLLFDGVDDYVDLKTGTGLPIYKGTGAPYTIAFWVKAPAQNDKRVYAEGSNLSNTPIITLGSGSGTNTALLRLYFRNDSNATVINTHSKGTVFDDTWHHVAFVDSSGRTALYIDGNLDSTDHYTRRPGSAGFGTFTMNKAAVGAVLRSSACCLLQGVVDDLRVYEFAAKKSDVGLMMLDVSLLPAGGSIGFYGDGCNGTLDIWATGSTAVGTTLQLSLFKGTPGASASLSVGLVKPFDLSAVGFPGCTAYADLATAFLLGIGSLDAAGSRSPIPLPIPNLPALNGVRAAIQGVAITSGTLSLSPAALLTVGR